MTRPRVEGKREVEILETTLRLLAEVGFDRLRLDSVAARAHVSKATIYRHWRGKVRLVADALSHALSGRATPYATDSLRNDLLAFLEDRSGLGDDTLRSALSGVFTAMTLDSDLDTAIRNDVLAGPLADIRAIFDRARHRGEVSADADVELLTSLVASFATNGLRGTDASMALGASHQRFVDGVVLPAAHSPCDRPRSR